MKTVGNPGDYLSIHTLNGTMIVGSSPETMVQDIADVHAQWAQRIEDLNKVKELIRRREPVFARIHDGARRGSVVRLKGLKVVVQNTAKSYYGDNKIKSGQVKNGLHYQFSGSKNGKQKWHNLSFTMPEVVGADSDALMFMFDDRATVPAKGLWSAIELLPDYQGPTVFQFTKNTLTDEQRALKESNYALVPLDRFGHPVALNAMFIYARPGNLLFGRLTKVAPSGVLTYQNIMDAKDTGRLMSPSSMECVVQNKPNGAMMRFDKGDVLSDRLMMEKLRR